jgi:hypothetical protein
MTRQQNLKQQKRSNNRDLLRYAGLGTQIFVSLGIAVFAGYKADQWINISFPLMIWLLPLLVLTLMIYKLVKDTSKRKQDINERKA